MFNSIHSHVCRPLHCLMLCARCRIIISNSAVLSLLSSLRHRWIEFHFFIRCKWRWRWIYRSIQRLPYSQSLPGLGYHKHLLCIIGTILILILGAIIIKPGETHGGSKIRPTKMQKVFGSEPYSGQSSSIKPSLNSHSQLKTPLWTALDGTIRLIYSDIQSQIRANGSSNTR